MSLTALPPPPRKVRLWHIFYALPAMNDPLPAEQKFRENTAGFGDRMYPQSFGFIRSSQM